MTIEDRARYLTFLALGFVFLAIMLTILAYRIYASHIYSTKVIGIVTSSEKLNHESECRLEIQIGNSLKKAVWSADCKEFQIGDSIELYRSQEGDVIGTEKVGLSLENMWIALISFVLLVFMVMAVRNFDFVLRSFDKDPPVG